MFHLVDFKGGRPKTVVPDKWLSINDTLCLLPAKVSDQDLEVLARNRVEPGEGWQIFGVKSSENFESFSDAKKQLEKSKGTPQLQASPQRKRKKTGYTSDYNILDFSDDQPSFTVFSAVNNEDEDDMSENEWEPPSVPQFIPRLNRLSSRQRIIPAHGNKRRIAHFNKSLPFLHKQTAEIKCACKSSCHGTILQALQSMQKQLDRTNQMVAELLTERTKPTLFNPKPKRTIFRQPYCHVNGQDEEEADDTNFGQSVMETQDTASTQRTTSATSFTEAKDTASIGNRALASEADVLKKIDVRKWLMSCLKGRQLISKLDSEVFFPNDRQLLVRIVCKKLMEECGNAYPTSLVKEKLAKEIVRAFPFLKSSRGAGHEAFYDVRTDNGFIAYRLKTVRKSLPIEEKRRDAQRDSQQQKGADNVELITVKEELLSQSDLEENVSWMKERDPNEENKTMIIAKLKESIKNRQKEIKETDMTVAEIFDRYPRLKDYNGEMITMEFTELYSNGEKLLQTFKSYFAPRIIAYVTLHKPHLLMHVSKCEDNLKSLLLLPELLPVPNYKRTNQTSRSSKGTQLVPITRKIPNPDLIIFVKSRENIKDAIADSDGQSLQPYLICVNPSQGSQNKKYFIRVDEILIEGPDDPMSAFDVLFKLHYVFNIQYAKSLENFYNFVSSIIYEIDQARSSSDAFYTLLRNIPVIVEEEDS